MGIVIVNGKQEDWSPQDGEPFIETDKRAIVCKAVGNGVGLEFFGGEKYSLAKLEEEGCLQALKDARFQNSKMKTHEPFLTLTKEVKE